VLKQLPQVGFLDFEIGDEELDDFTPRVRHCEFPRLRYDGDALSDAVPGTRHQEMK
jgi:hypothetical protein